MTQCNVRKNYFDSITPSMVKKMMHYMPIPNDQKWRVPLLNELTSTRNADTDIDIPGFSPEEIKDLIQWLTTS